MVTALTLITTLAVYSITTLVTMRQVMMDQIDRQLETTSTLLAREVLGSTDMPRSNSFPSDYYVRYVEFSGFTQERYSTSTYSYLQLPAVDAQDLLANPPHSGEPFTVRSTDGTIRWRMVSGPVMQYFQPVGVMVIALPLDGVDDAAARLTKVLSLLGLGVAALGLVGVYFAVRRSLRPLEEIEKTSGRIAAGDLSQRVASTHPGTELGHLAAALNTMLGQIEDSFAAREASNEQMRQFIADASHELRTPLASVRGYSELYRLGAIDSADQVSETFGRIEGSAVRMSELVDGLLTLARLDAQRNAELVAVPVSQLLTHCVREVESAYPDHPLTLTPVPLVDAVAGTELAVLADHGWLTQVVTNLLVNACVHTPAGTPVSVGAVLLGSEVEIFVADAGGGIPAAHQERIFERFYRVDPSRARSSGGSGLGLSIVASLVESMGGAVTLSSDAESGTRFAVRLPRAQQDD